MEGTDILLWARAAERLSITALSGLSLVLGWDLFRRGVIDAQTADLKASSWSIRFQRVGPGCFFALFGTVVFAYALSHPLTVTPSTTQAPARATATTAGLGTQEQFSYAASAHPTSDKDLITAINTYVSVALPRTKNLDARESRAVDTANHVMTAYKRALLLQHFGPMATKYMELRDKVATNPAILAAENQETQLKYAEIEGWDLDTFVKQP